MEYMRLDTEGILDKRYVSHLRKQVICMCTAVFFLANVYGILAAKAANPSVFSLVMMVLALVIGGVGSGVLSDIGGRKISMGSALLMSGVAAVLLLALSDVGGVLTALVRMVLGMGIGGMLCTSMVMAFEYSRRSQRYVVLAWVMGMGSIGQYLSIVVMRDAQTADVIGSILLIMSVLMTLGLLVWWRKKSPESLYFLAHQQNHAAISEQLRQLNLPMQSVSSLWVKTHTPTTTVSWVVVVWLCCVMMLLVSVVMVLFNVKMTALFVNARHVYLPMLNTALWLNTLAGVLGMVGMAYAMDKWYASWVMLWASGLAALCLVLLAWGFETPNFLMYVPIVGLAASLGGLVVGIKTLAIECAPTAFRTLVAASVYAMVFVTPLLSLWLLKQPFQQGQYASLVYLAVPMLLLALLMWWLSTLLQSAIKQA